MVRTGALPPQLPQLQAQVVAVGALMGHGWRRAPNCLRQLMVIWLAARQNMAQGQMQHVVAKCGIGLVRQCRMGYGWPGKAPTVRTGAISSTLPSLVQLQAEGVGVGAPTLWPSRRRAPNCLWQLMVIWSAAMQNMAQEHRQRVGTKCVI